MQPFSRQWPKPLLPVGGKPILVRQMEILAGLGVREVLVVIGHLGTEIVRALGNGSRFNCRIRYVQQEQPLGIAHALYRVAAHVNRPFFLFLGDIFFEFHDLDEMVRRFVSGSDGVLAVKREPNPKAIERNFLVIASENGAVSRVIEKPRRPTTDLKGCGFYLLSTAIFDAVRKTPRTALRNEYEITDSIQTLIDDGGRVEAAEVVVQDVNLSYPEDLLNLNMQLRARSGQQNIVADGVVRDPAARLVHSVVMQGARLERGADLDKCLVFPNTLVRAGVWKRAILTPGGEVSCAD